MLYVIYYICITIICCINQYYKICGFWSVITFVDAIISILFFTYFFSSTTENVVEGSLNH